MNPASHVVPAALCLLLGACGSSDKEPPPPPPVEQTAFGDMVSTKDKARAVQDVMDTRPGEVDKRLEEQESAEH